MAKILIFSENYGSPGGTGGFIASLGQSLSARGHSVAGKTSLGLSFDEIKSINPDVIIGQHQAASVARMAADHVKVPFVFVMHDEHYNRSAMPADALLFLYQSRLDACRPSLGSMPAAAVDGGFDKACEIIIGLAQGRSQINETTAHAAVQATQATQAAHAAREAPQEHATRADDAQKEATEAAIAAESRRVEEARLHTIAASHAPIQAPRAAVVTPPAPVSIVIVAQDDKDVIDQTLRSVLSQTFPHIEIIAIDDGSVDGTHQTLLNVHDPRMTVYSRPKRMGRHSARNLGIQQSSGEFIMFLDAGDTLRNDVIGALYAQITAKSKPGLVFGRQLRTTESLRSWVFVVGGIPAEDAFSVADSIVLYRRESLRAVDPFKTMPTIREMDADMIGRAAGATSIMYVDTPVGSRRGSAASQ